MRDDTTQTQARVAVAVLVGVVMVQEEVVVGVLGLAVAAQRR